jgi:hypothetical protein
MLSKAQQEKFISELEERKKFLEAQLAMPSDLAAAIETSSQQQRAHHRWNNLLWGVGAGFVVGAGSILALEYFVMAMGKQFTPWSLGYTRQVLWPLFGSLGVSLGAAVGFGYSYAKSSTLAHQGSKRYAHRRFEELVKAAEIPAELAQAASVPLNFFDRDRFEFVVGQLSAFHAVEILIREEDVSILEVLEKQLIRLGYLNPQELENTMESTDIDLKLMREGYLRKLHERELGLIQRIQKQIDPLPDLKLAPSLDSCMAWMSRIDRTP